MTMLETTVSTDFDATRQKWNVRSRVNRYASLESWIDAGERLGIGTIADEVRGTPILDLGVGAGRTTSLMRLLTDDYVGVDWSPEMVAASRARYPGTDFRQGDARDLSFLPDASIKLVFFSYNGFDYNDHDERAQAMAEVCRILSPDGILAYSTLSKDGPLYGERPWKPGSGRTRRSELLAVASYLFHLPARWHKCRTEYANWSTNRSQAKDYGEWAIAPSAHVDFALVHFSTIEAERSLLGTAGLTIADVFTSDGRHIDPYASSVETGWFFVIARKA